MTDIKMIDVFGKEVHFNPYNGTLNDPVDYGEWAEFNSEDALVAAAHAINSHDGLVEEIAALKTYASKGDEEIKSLDEQLAAAKAEIEKLSPLVEIVSNQKQMIQQLEEDLTQVSATSKRYIDRNEKRKDKAKAEIAEYREALECLIIEHGIHDSYDGGLLPDNEQSDTVRVAINLLAKHKATTDEQ